MSPRLVVALVVSAVAVVVLVVVALRGTGSGPEPTTTTATVTTLDSPTPDHAAPESTGAVSTLPRAPITVLPDWYRKGSSRYEERRPTTTVPPGSR